MVNPDQLNDVIDVIDNSRNTDRGQTLRILFPPHTIAGQLLLRSIAFCLAGCALNYRRNLRINFFLLFAPSRFVVFRLENNANDTARFCQRANHFVIQVARYVGNRAAG